MNVGKIGQSGATESQLIGEYALNSLAGAYCVRVTGNSEVIHLDV